MNLNNYSVRNSIGWDSYPMEVSKKTALLYIKSCKDKDNHSTFYIQETQALLAIIYSEGEDKNYYVINFFEDDDLREKHFTSCSTLECVCKSGFGSVKLNDSKLDKLKTEYYKRGFTDYSDRFKFDKEEIEPIRIAVKNRFARVVIANLIKHGFEHMDSNLWESGYFGMTVSIVNNVAKRRREYGDLFNKWCNINMGVKVAINSIFATHYKELYEITDNKFAVVVQDEDRYYTRTIFLIEIK